MGIQRHRVRMRIEPAERLDTYIPIGDHRRPDRPLGIGAHAHCHHFD